ncbi:MAG: response regulator [Lachnospiraceae bacterium]|nr:response regulator [Lachnospiraceae bacterium]
MFCQLFGKYLLEQQAINDFDYKTLINEQMNVRVRLGTIAVAEGLMTEEQVEKVNRLQMTQDKRFGDIAVEQGLITDDQLSALLKKQGDPYLQFVQLLTDLTDIGATKLDEYIEDFRKKSGFSDKEMDALKKDDIDGLLDLFVVSSKPYVSSIAGMFLRNLTRFVSRDFYIEKAYRAKEYEYRHLSSQELSGDASILVAVAESKDEGAFLQVANGFSGHEMDTVSEDAYDSVGEFINVSCGLFASEMSRKEMSVDMEPPLAFSGQKASGDFYVVPVVLCDRRMELLISVNSDFVAGENPIKTGSAVHSFVSSSEEHEGKRILIVDDSRMSRQMLRNILEKAGFKIVGEAENGRAGVEAYKECKPDAVTLDITMPEMDGIEALEHIIKDDPGANAVMITAAGQQDKLIKALRIGAKRFISKPFNEEEIIKNIHEVLE